MPSYVACFKELIGFHRRISIFSAICEGPGCKVERCIYNEMNAISFYEIY